MSREFEDGDALEGRDNLSAEERADATQRGSGLFGWGVGWVARSGRGSIFAGRVGNQARRCDLLPPAPPAIGGLQDGVEAIAGGRGRSGGFDPGSARSRGMA